MVKYFLLLITLFSIAPGLGAAENSLTLYLYKSPTLLNWDTPRTLTRTVLSSVLKDELSGHNGVALGHISVEVKCADDWSFHSGMTQSNPTESMNVLVKQRKGLSVLTHKFAGRFETPKEIANRFKANEVNYNFISFAINGAACQRAKEYVRQYEEQNIGKYYGLSLIPLKKEGAGCAAFALSFLELIGVLDPESKQPWLKEQILEKWMKTLIIPARFMGNTSLAKLSLKQSTWEVMPGEDSTTITFGEPNSIHNWIESVTHNTLESTSRQISGREIYGLEADLTDVETPTGPIFQSTQR